MHKGLKEAISDYLNDRGYLPDDVEEIIDIREEETSGGYCETCWYTDFETVITYRSTDGTEKTIRQYAKLVDFMSWL